MSLNYCTISNSHLHISFRFLFLEYVGWNQIVRISIKFSWQRTSWGRNHDFERQPPLAQPGCEAWRPQNQKCCQIDAGITEKVRFFSLLIKVWSVRLEAETTTMEGSLYLQSLAGSLGGHKIKNFVKSMHKFLKGSISFLRSVGRTTWCWNHNLKSLPVTIGGQKIKKFVKSMQEFMKKFDFSRYL